MKNAKFNMLITVYDCYNVLLKVYGDNAYLKQALSNTQIEELNRAAVTKITYGVLDKDVTLTYIIKKLCDKNPKLPIRVILKIALYQIIYLNTAPYAVTNACVELVKKLGKGGVSGFVNAVLRKYINSPVAIPKDGVTGLSLTYSYPEFAVKRLVADYGKEVAVKIMSADEEHTFVRFNDGVDGEEYLKSLNKSYELTPFKNLFLVKNFKMNDGFYEGLYTFQSIGSVAVAEAVGGGNSLLDACSAPGGKAVYLADKFLSVTAEEVYPHRVELIKSYAERMKKSNVTAVLGDGTVLNEAFLNVFDCVLADVPCSGYGVVKDNPDIKLHRTEESVAEINETQLKILNTVKNYVKTGGYLCYSTCSVFRAENDGVIEAFLSENKNFSVQKCDSPLGHVKTEYGMQFLPHISMNAGFYFCKLKKGEL